MMIFLSLSSFYLFSNTKTHTRIICHIPNFSHVFFFHFYGTEPLYFFLYHDMLHHSINVFVINVLRGEKLLKENEGNNCLFSCNFVKSFLSKTCHLFFQLYFSYIFLFFFFSYLFVCNRE